MKTFIIAATFVMVFAFQAAADVVKLTESIDEHGKRIEYVTTTNVLEKCPTWTVDKEPPYPIHKAIDVARQWIKKRYPKFTSYKIVNISIRPIWDLSFKERWYYGVTVNAAADLDGVSASSVFNILVLMNGTVIEPTSPKNN